MSLKSTLPKGVGRDLSHLPPPARPPGKPASQRHSDEPHLTGAASTTPSRTEPTKTERTGANGQ